MWVADRECPHAAAWLLWRPLQPSKKRATKSTSDWRPLTQQEMLAEAALNEIENTRYGAARGLKGDLGRRCNAGRQEVCPAREMLGLFAPPPSHSPRGALTADALITRHAALPCFAPQLAQAAPGSGGGDQEEGGGGQEAQHRAHRALAVATDARGPREGKGP
jgi:hypothetical protein